MGVWEWITSTTDLFKRNTPDVTSVTEACRKGYDVSRATTAHVDGTVRTKARDIHAYLSDDDVRSNIGTIAKHSALFLARSYGGGPIIDIVTKSVKDSEVDSHKEKLEALEAKVAKLERELSSRKTLDQAEIPEASMKSKAPNEPKISANMSQRPEDVLHIFMTQQFIGRKFLDDLIVPGAGSRREEKTLSSSSEQ